MDPRDPRHQVVTVLLCALAALLLGFAGRAC